MSADYTFKSIEARTQAVSYSAQMGNIPVEKMKDLVATYIHLQLENCSDIKYNESLVDALLQIINLNDCSYNFLVTGHLMKIVKLYVLEVLVERKIKVLDQPKFDSEWEHLGLPEERKPKPSKKKAQTKQRNPQNDDGMYIQVLLCLVSFGLGILLCFLFVKK
eukprot:Phypoly_transcript_17645.p1 GENE.Phypoly_transcript_17645~~Phypoly_transcript_17645.p1  ORF type:complete len:163 (+),score=20.91 Phypoly_transcript_17645:175-663(+)